LERITGFKITGNKVKNSQYLVQGTSGGRGSWVPVSKILKNRLDILDFLNREIDEVIIKLILI